MGIANNQSQWLDSDDFQLARLSCVRLAKLLEGTISIGVPALDTRVPEPFGFFNKQFEIMAAYALVMDTVSAPPDSTDKVLRLRQCSGEIRRELVQLHRQLESIQPIGLIQESIISICGQMSAYANWIGAEMPLIAEVRQTSLKILAATGTTSASPTTRSDELVAS